MSILMIHLFRTIILCGILLLFVASPTYALEPEQSLKIGEKHYTLSELKKQFKTHHVVVVDNPEYAGITKEYDAFDFNEILAKGLHANLENVKRDQLVIINTKDEYLSQIPLRYFTSKGKAYLAYQETPNSQSRANKTKDGRWEYIAAHGTQVDPGPFYLVWDSPQTYPTGWPYQVISIRIVTTHD
ncbi:hypothetical protein [Legionella sp. W05-934-2]|uniref:hypothetical protein n=1 Tax=Legionella sp. W05-934-2 TaxID=1198649 RepID=UPI0034624DEA